MENEPQIPDICARLAEIRCMHFGQRGKAKFARVLGIGPSTYNHYELDRVPPPALLVRAARETGTSLEWLLTGEGSSLAARGDQGGDNLSPIFDRLQTLLARSPELHRSVVGFLDLLDDVAGQLPELKPDDDPRSIPHEGMIPVVGGTAAGPAQFWTLRDHAVGGPQADARLEQLLQQQADRSIQAAELVAGGSEPEIDEQVALVQFSRPDDAGIVEFLACPSAKLRHPGLVAWRIDGDSMVPRYRDGDFVLTSADTPAVLGHPCVARQAGQIGVNCKIFHREGDDVVLIPVNESVPTQRFPTDQLQWAYRVLYTIRLTGRTRRS